MEILIIFGATSLCLVGTGIYIWKKEAIHLLSNFPKDPERIKDRPGLARWAGLFLIFIASLLATQGFLIQWLDETPYALVPLAAGIPLIGLSAVIYMVGGQKYLK